VQHNLCTLAPRADNQVCIHTGRGCQWHTRLHEGHTGDAAMWLQQYGVPYSGWLWCGSCICGFPLHAMLTKQCDVTDVKYASRNVLEDPELRQGIKSFTAWPTIPQVFVAGEFVGGSDILMGMHNSGELEKLLSKVKK
jgi:glutaredoxin-related protein